MPQQVSSEPPVCSQDCNEGCNNYQTAMRDDQTQQIDENSIKQATSLNNGISNQSKQQKLGSKAQQAPTTTTTTKQNGLKNRIIQRPPPLNLNEVSNLYHVNELPSVTNNSSNNNNDQQQQQQSSANHKFWASLNRNAASRTQSNSHNTSNSNSNKQHELSNTSTDLLDDSSTHGGPPSESGGGNLIGIDHPSTPPVDSSGRNISASPNRSDEPPASACSNRSRSNNPFLAMDEDEPNSPSPTLKIFHKRPASFIAATGSAIMKRQAALLNNSFPNNRIVNSDAAAADTSAVPTVAATSSAPITTANTMTTITSQMLQERFDAMNFNDNIDNHSYHELYTHNNLDPIYQHARSQDHDSYGQLRNNFNERAISMDSESTVCQPPPSATLQLPYWTDAIYELNNAILDTNSVAGGAEDGKFIHIVENGDIILELDQLKVSGFTLSEFNELVESRPVHLLRAVQTKHSHGLTTDLKQYLSTSFPKGSHDKDLQDLIRENIYRGTIPCTTRPPKDGEVDKVDYHFLTREQFVEMNERGMLLECGVFNGHYYGTIKPYSDMNSLSIYGAINKDVLTDQMQQPMNSSHAVIGLPDPSNSIYGNYDPYQMHQMLNQSVTQAPIETNVPEAKNSSIVAVDSEALPPGWERVIDQTHGTYYIDHNTQQTQYERPYEIELTKSSIGFGFTLVEAENGMLLVRSIIPGGPAQFSGMMRPGDILVSAVGVSVHGLQHTDVARLFSTFAVGDRVRMTFARSNYIMDNNLVADEYLFSNGTNGDLAVAYNPNSINYFNQNMISHEPQAQASQDHEFIAVQLKRGDQGFGFTISDSEAGQRVKKIQNNETCANLKQGDILINLNGQDITRLTHKQVVESLKNCPPGQDVSLVIKRKKRSPIKAPMGMANIENIDHMNQYMMTQSMSTAASHDYGYMPLYSNAEMIQSEPPMLPMRPAEVYFQPNEECISQHQNYYANLEEMAFQRLRHAQTNHVLPFDRHDSIHYHHQSSQDEEEYENLQIDLDKGRADMNWGIRLIGGSEVGRAISIGSIVFGGAASKNGKLKSGDEIISINGINVVGATHQDVVKLISSCSNRASLIVRRNKFAEACEVILTRNIDEGFGFVIISDENAALIGRIIKGSPADRCQQLHVRDQIVAVNGRRITPNMKHPDIVNMIKGCGSTLRLRVIPAHCYTVELIKSAQNDNFGFSMRGGNEYDGMPLYILRVAANGLARDLLNVGDQIIEINGIPTAGMTHAQAATIIKKSDPIVKLKLRHNEQIPPGLLVDSPRALQQFNQVTAEVKAVVQTSTGTSATDLSDKSASLEQQQHATTATVTTASQQHQQQPTGQHQVTSNHLMQSRGLPLYAT